MSIPNPQPPGGGPVTLDVLQSAATEASLVIHSPPDVPANSQVLGICAVPEEYADPNKYGWMVSDFAAWKAIFYGVGTRSSQTWLSSLNIDTFLSGSGFPAEMIPKVLGARKDHIAEIPTDSMECANALFTCIGQRAQEANKNGTSLFIMFFAPTTPEQDVCIDFGGPEGAKAFLTTEKIRGVIKDAVGHENLPVVLMTPSPFTGGWVCNRSLFDRPNESVTDGSVTNVNSLIRFIAKSCGAVFANRIIRYHTTRGSPFVSDDQRDKVKYENMMPIWPTKEQLGSLHEFHRKIHETLEQRLSVLAGKHSFNFDDAKDNWNTCGPRKSFPLAKWEARWNRAADRHLDENAGFPFLGEAFGGTRASQFFHIKYLVFIELQTCPGDWQRPITGGTKDLFMNFMQEENLDDDTIKRVFDAVEYRSSSMTMAQILIKGLGMPLPDGLKCRYWTDKTDDHVAYKKLQLAFSEIHNLFDHVALLPGETRHEYKGVRFWRPSRWMAASIASHFAGDSEQKVIEFVQKKVAPFMRLISATQNSLLLENDSIKQQGAKWIASLGLEPRVDFASTSHGHHSEQGQNHIDNKRKRVLSDNANDTTAELTATERPLLKKTVQDHPVKPETASHGPSKNPAQQMFEKPAEQPAQHVAPKPDAKPVVNPVMRPVAKPTINTAMPPVAKPVVNTAMPPVAKPAVNPVMQPVAKPVVNPVMPPVSKPSVKPEAKTSTEPVTKSVMSPISRPAAEPAAKSAAKSPAKNAHTGTEGGPIGEPANQRGNETSIKSTPASVNKPVQGTAAKSLSRDGADVNHNPFKDGGGPSRTTNQEDFKNDTVPAVASGSASVPGIGLSDLATADLETLLKSNPVVLAQVLSKALALLKIQEEEARAAASSGVGGSTSATAEVTETDTAILASNVIGGILEDAGSGARASPVVRSSIETRVEPLGTSDLNKPEGAARPSLINPTPPGTPTNGRGTEGSGSQARPNAQRRAAPNGKLADEKDFLKAVKW